MRSAAEAFDLAVLPERAGAVRPASIFLRRAWRLKAAVAGFVIVAGVSGVSVFAPAVAPHDPYEQEVASRLLPPVWQAGGSTTYLLGTDPVGRDILSRIIFGSRVSLAAGVLATLMAGTIGLFLGLAAGYFGGRVDRAISGAVDIMLAFPFLLLALAAIAILGPSFRNMIIVLGITGWPVYTRVVRAETLRLRELEFVVAARGLGGRTPRVVARHVLPNVLNSIIVISSLEVARNILSESFLSFLGLGVQPPTPSWGGMLGEGRVYVFARWWLATFPGLAIFVTTLGINLAGDGLRDFLDPRSKL